MAQADSTIRKQVAEALHGGHAHAPLEQAVKNFPAKLRGVVPQGASHSAWQVLEHIRIAQDDMVRFSLNHDGSYNSPEWPEGYWPKAAEPPSTEAWNNSIRAIEDDREKMIRLVSDPNNDLLEVFPWGDGQNLLREALLIADHNSYHLGELVLLRRLLGAGLRNETFVLQILSSITKAPANECLV